MRGNVCGWQLPRIYPYNRILCGYFSFLQSKSKVVWDARPIPRSNVTGSDQPRPKHRSLLPSAALLARRGDRVVDVEGYSSNDIAVLLNCIDRVKSVGGNDWEQGIVLYRETYVSRFARASREVYSIRGKLKNLLNCKKPTVDPSCPFLVRAARRIQSDLPKNTDKCGTFYIFFQYKQIEIKYF